MPKNISYEDMLFKQKKNLWWKSEMKFWQHRETPITPCLMCPFVALGLIMEVGLCLLKEHVADIGILSEVAAAVF